MNYVLQPSRRGAFAIERASTPRPRSRLGFWQYLIDDPADPTAIHVYPDMQQLSQYALLARTNRLSLLGVRAVAKNRPGPRFRAAPRLQHRRQLPTHRLAGDRAAAKTHRQGFPGQPEPADHLHDRLRPDDDQPGGLLSACSITRSTPVRMLGYVAPAAGRQRRHDHLLRRD